MALRRHAALARHKQNRIAGQNPDEPEGHECDPEERGNQIKKFADEEADHARTCKKGAQGSPPRARLAFDYSATSTVSNVKSPSGLITKPETLADIGTYWVEWSSVAHGAWSLKMTWACS